jgi:hypothetical protein
MGRSGVRPCQFLSPQGCTKGGEVDESICYGLHAACDTYTSAVKRMRAAVTRAARDATRVRPRPVDGSLDDAASILAGLGKKKK